MNQECDYSAAVTRVLPSCEARSDLFWTAVCDPQDRLGPDRLRHDIHHRQATDLFAEDILLFTAVMILGRGNEIVCMAIERVAQRLVGKDTESLFADMGATWSFLMSDPQMRWQVIPCVCAQ